MHYKIRFGDGDTRTVEGLSEERAIREGIHQKLVDVYGESYLQWEEFVFSVTPVHVEQGEPLLRDHIPPEILKLQDDGCPHHPE
jgi:hypothetical protein